MGIIVPSVTGLLGGKEEASLITCLAGWLMLSKYSVMGADDEENDRNNRAGTLSSKEHQMLAPFP